MCADDEKLIEDWQNIADGWKNKCLTHIITLTKVAEMVNQSRINQSKLYKSVTAERQRSEVWMTRINLIYQ